MSLVPFLGRGSLQGDVTSTATTSPTANSVVARTSSGYLKDRASSDTCVFPGYRRLIAELGYTALDALYRCQDEAGPTVLASNGNSSDPTLAKTNTPTFNYWSNGFRGIYLDTDGDCFGYQQDVLDFGTSSVHLAVAFTRITDTGAIQNLVGRYAATRYLNLAVSSADKAIVLINDGTRNTNPDVSATAIAVGSTYLLQLHLRKDDGTLKTRLSKWGTGLVSAEVSTDVSAYTTLAGGTTPGFSVGAGSGWGTGINFHGVLLRIGTDCNVANRMSTLASLTGFE